MEFDTVRLVPVVTHSERHDTQCPSTTAASDSGGDRWKEVFWERRDSAAQVGALNVYQFIMLSAIALVVDRRPPVRPAVRPESI